jgi:hypothetical protein
MCTRSMVVTFLVLSAASSAILFGQQQPAPSGPSGVREFPVILEQSVVAGKTPVGSKIQAKLEVATSVDGTVIPRNAIFSGEVLESVAKTRTDPSCLAIRMDSVQWKNGSASLKVLLDRLVLPG